MAPRGIFSYHNLESTADLNARFTGLVAKGIYSGGRMSVVGGSYTVTVSPYLSITSDGMMVSDTEDTNISVPSDAGKYYVVIDAVYNPAGAAIISLRAVSSADFSAYSSKYICIGTVTIPIGASGVSTTYFSYVERNQVTPVQDSKFLGYFVDDSARAIAYPSTVPYRQRTGDFTITGTSSVNLKFGFWATSSWVDFTNPGAVLDLLNTHISDMSMHVSVNEKAAIVGTFGTPSSSNKFVTSSDSRILAADERAALSAALSDGSPLSGSNPVVSKKTAIAVPKVFQIAVPVTGSTITISAAVLGTPDFSVYLGKQGVLSGVSSAVQYFAVEDDFGNGYISPVSQLPVYVVDIQDSTHTTINPESLSDSRGFYVAGSASIILVLNTDVPSSARPSIRMNVLGDMSAMTPNWAGSASSFLPAITAFRNGKQSFASALQAEFTALTIGSRAGTDPNTTISTSTVGALKNIRYAFNAGTAAAVASLVVTVAGTGVGTSLFSSPVVQFSYDGSTTNGVRIDSTGVKTNTGLLITDAGFGSVIAGIGSTGRLMLAHGTEDAPALYFNADGITTGLYYVTEYDTTAPTYTLAVYNGVGVSIAGKTALFIGRNSDTSSITGLDCSLLLLQSYNSSTSAVDYYYGMQNELSGAAIPGALRFGAWADSSVFDAALVLDIANRMVTTVYALTVGKQILGKNLTIAADELLPSYSFTGATSTGMFYVDTWTNQLSGASYSNGVGFSINGHAALIVTRDISVGSGTITGQTANPLILNQHAIDSDIYYDFAIADAADGGAASGGMRFGYVGYTGAFRPMLSLDTTTGEDIGVAANLNIEDAYSINIGTNLVIDTGSIQFNNVDQKISTASGAIYIGNVSTAYLNVDPSGRIINTYGLSRVHPALGTSTAALELNSGSVVGTISTSIAGMLLNVGTTNSDDVKIGWGSSNTVRGYLSTSGKVYAQRANDVVSYGFMTSPGGINITDVGIGTNASNNLVLHGSVLIANGLTVPSGVTLSIASGAVLSIAGTLSLTSLAVAGNISSTSITIPVQAFGAENYIGNTLKFNNLIGRPGYGSAPSHIHVDDILVTTVNVETYLGVGDGNLGPASGSGFAYAMTVDGRIDTKDIVTSSEKIMISAPLVLDVASIMYPFGAYTTISRLLRLSKTLTPTSTAAVITDLGSRTTPIILDGNKTHHIIRLKNSIPLDGHLSGTSNWQNSSAPGHNKVSPPALGPGGIGAVGTVPTDYGPNIEANDAGATTWLNDLALQIDGADFPSEANIGATAFAGTVFKIIFMADQLCDENFGVDLVDNSLVSSGRWAPVASDYVTIGGIGDPDAGVVYKKFAEYRFVDQASTDYGYFDDAHGFELTLIRVPDGRGFTSVPIDDTNWVSYITRFGKR